jgi:hypothetical protein
MNACRQMTPGIARICCQGAALQTSHLTPHTKDKVLAPPTPWPREQALSRPHTMTPHTKDQMLALATYSRVQTQCCPHPVHTSSYHKGCTRGSSCPPTFPVLNWFLPEVCLNAALACAEKSDRCLAAWCWLVVVDACGCFKRCCCNTLAAMVRTLSQKNPRRAWAMR